MLYLWYNFFCGRWVVLGMSSLLTSQWRCSYVVCCAVLCCVCCRVAFVGDNLGNFEVIDLRQGSAVQKGCSLHTK